MVDLSDPQWIRLVAEPADHNGWLSFGLLAEVLAVVLLGLAWRRRYEIGRLLRGTHPALAVLVVQGEDGSALVLAADADGRGAGTIGGGAVARFVPGQSLMSDPVDGLWVEPDDDEESDDLTEAELEGRMSRVEQEMFGRAWRGDADAAEELFGTAAEPEPAVLVGTLRDGGTGCSHGSR